MSQTCLNLSKTWTNLSKSKKMTKYTKRWQNTQKFEWMTDKAADDDDDYYKVIPWIASSKSSDQ